MCVCGGGGGGAGVAFPNLELSYPLKIGGYRCEKKSYSYHNCTCMSETEGFLTDHNSSVALLVIQ